MTRTLSSGLTLALVLCAGRAGADTAVSAHRWGLRGGATLGRGHALWASAGFGSDVNGLLNAQVGYAIALGERLDLSAALQGNIGVGTAAGGMLRARWGVVRSEGFALALEVPVQLNAYVDSLPRLLVFGVEPGVMMSSFFGDHFELFYGAAYRLFTLARTVLTGPQLRLGVAVPFRHFDLFLAGHGSCLFGGGPSAIPTLGAELGLAFRFGS